MKKIFALVLLFQLCSCKPTAKDYFDEGDIYLNKGLQNEAAIQAYTKAIITDSAYTIAYTQRGMAKLRLRNYTSALQDGLKALKLDPKFADAYFIIGAAQGGLNNNKGAIEMYNKGIAVDPKAARCYFDCWY